MKILCKLGFHKWGNLNYNQCICDRCMATRHVINECICERCKREFHKWELVESSDKYVLRKCALCGKTRKEIISCDHDWKPVRSTDEYEDWKCTKCGKTKREIKPCKDDEHEWELVRSWTEDEFSYESGNQYYTGQTEINEYRCKKCGMTKTE